MTLEKKRDYSNSLLKDMGGSRYMKNENIQKFRNIQRPIKQENQELGV